MQNNRLPGYLVEGSEAVPRENPGEGGDPLVLDPSSNTRQVMRPSLMTSPAFAGTKWTGMWFLGNSRPGPSSTSSSAGADMLGGLTNKERYRIKTVWVVVVHGEQFNVASSPFGRPFPPDDGQPLSALAPSHGAMFRSPRWPQKAVILRKKNPSMPTHSAYGVGSVQSVLRVWHGSPHNSRRNTTKSPRSTLSIATSSTTYILRAWSSKAIHMISHRFII